MGMKYRLKPSSSLDWSILLPHPCFADYHIQITRKLEDKTILERHSVVLSCDFRPSPKHVKWFKGQVLLEPSEKYKIKRDQYSAELKIMKVKPEDAGVYKCRAGIAETEATLSVEGTRGLQQQGWPVLVFMILCFTQGSSSWGEVDPHSYLLILYKCSVTSKLLVPQCWNPALAVKLVMRVGRQHLGKVQINICQDTLLSILCKELGLWCF